MSDSHSIHARDRQRLVECLGGIGRAHRWRELPCDDVAREVVEYGTVYGIRHREEWQKQLPSSIRTRATRLYEYLDFLLEQKKQAEGDLLREAKKHPVAKILETAPGFWPIRAARLLPIVVTPHRFRTRRQFSSYCGFGIVARSSSDWVQAADGTWSKARVPQPRGVSLLHKHSLKSIVKGAATTVITQRNKDPIYRRYERLIDGSTKPNLAKLSLARMIAATVLRMWKDEKEYDPDEPVRLQRHEKARQRLDWRSRREGNHPCMQSRTEFANHALRGREGEHL